MTFSLIFGQLTSFANILLSGLAANGMDAELIPDGAVRSIECD